jgi:hypothetical protein
MCRNYIRCATQALNQIDTAWSDFLEIIDQINHSMQNIYANNISYISFVHPNMVLAAQLGNPRGRYDEHNDKFPSIVKARFNRPVGEINHFWRLMLAGFW